MPADDEPSQARASASTRSWSWGRSTPGCSPTPGGDASEILAGIGEHLQRPGSELVRGAGGIAEGIPEGFAEVPAVPKFRPGGLLLAYAGGGAGLFSMIIGGWANGAIGSTPVTRAVQY